ncbi:unnamed protein product [Spirodela intermedia]|uniref:Uncharacterized protein n=1 Tax=Spirodela intermedia TaxID=51605 RepID=A0A7I8J0Q9_SPIIN|nr:unnamed protein product [Spirodela intermedia]CAA6663728.1 unnamed protein product [Spirodela intermedia]
MGLSRLIGMKAAVLFLGFLCTRNSGIALVPVFLLHASLVSSLVAITSHPSLNLPLLLGKSSDGSFPLWSILLFAPYLVFIRIFVFLRRLKSREPVYRWPSSPHHLPPGDPAVIDCTCELPRSSALSSNAYLCVATWDTRAPRPSEIESAVRWACRKRAQNNPVYIHVLLVGSLSLVHIFPPPSHGRSVCVMCALLVALGAADDWKAAERMIMERRPFIQMNALHGQHLEEWSRHRISPPPNRRGLWAPPSARVFSVTTSTVEPPCHGGDDDVRFVGRSRRRMKIVYSQSFHVAGPDLWNSLAGCHVGPRLALTCK